jgi:hypothetical protein
MMGLVAFLAIVVLFSAAKKGASEAAQFAKPYAKHWGIIILLIFLAFVALSSAPK